MTIAGGAVICRLHKSVGGDLSFSWSTARHRSLAPRYLEHLKTPVSVS
jgi:hypothetical protein